MLRIAVIIGSTRPGRKGEAVAKWAYEIAQRRSDAEFFDVIQRGLAGLVDGKHYFDTIADDAVFEFRYDFPGWPRRTDSRDALMALYRGYGDRIVLNGADALVVHPCRDGRVVVLEYEVYGRVVASDATYENRFVSIVTIENRKVVLWRDYMDSLAAMRALSR